MGSDEMDYSQGLPMPATTEGLGGDFDLMKIISSAWPIALIAVGVIAISYFSGALGEAGMAGLEGPRRRRKMTKKAGAFLHHKIRTIVKEGKPQSQAVRIAFEMARKAGYKVPPPPK